MVINGGARGGPRQLADHLLRTDHNETINILHMEGIDAPDLHTALHEMHLIGKGAQSKRTLYHANIDPRADERLTKEQNHIAVERLAEKLGLTGQAYVVVEHVKKGRHHLHVVWSRIDLETMTAIPDNHNYPKHEAVSADLAREFGHEHVQGAHHDREGKKRPGRTPTFADYQQAARAGMTPQQQTEIITACWQLTETGKELQKYLEAAGFILARGDRRDFVVVDQAGAVQSLARKIEGVKAAEVRQRMSDVNQPELPGIEEARERQKQLELKLQPPDKGFVGASERLQFEEQQREREGKKGPRAQLGGMNGEIADALFHLRKTMQDQVAATVANSQTHRRDNVQQEATRPAERPAVAPEKTAAELLREQNKIQPIRDEETTQQRSMEAIADRITRTVAENKAREERNAAIVKRAQSLRNRDKWGNLISSPQEIAQLNRDISRDPNPTPVQRLDWELTRTTGSPAAGPPRRETVEQILDRKKAEMVAQRKSRQQEASKQAQRENPRPRPKLNVRSLDRDRGYGE